MGEMPLRNRQDATSFRAQNQAPVALDDAPIAVAHRWQVSLNPLYNTR